MFLLGRHAILGQEPPIYLRSTTATRLPSLANVHAATVDPVPPPRITRSNSSGCDFLRTWADGEVSVCSCDFSFLSDTLTLDLHRFDEIGGRRSFERQSVAYFPHNT